MIAFFFSVGFDFFTAINAVFVVGAVLVIWFLNIVAWDNTALCVFLLKFIKMFFPPSLMGGSTLNQPLK